MTDQNAYVEQSLLGAILNKPNIFPQLKVTEDDFYHPTNKKIFQAMGELYVDGIPIAPDTLSQHLNDLNMVIYLSSLTENTISSNWFYYDAKLRELSAHRQLKNLSREIERLINKNENPREIVEHVNDKLRTIKQHLEDKLPMHDLVRKCVLSISGVFLNTDIHRELSLTSRRDKQTANMALLRLEREGVIVKHGTKRGSYRVVEQLSEIIDHINADDTPLDIVLPFGLHKHMEWFPKGIGVVAGDSDAGKTALLLNLAYHNQPKFDKIIYIATEMGPALLKRRLKKFCQANGIVYPNHIQKITFIAPNTKNLMDLVDPSAMNIIDYYELTGNQFKDVAGYFREIYDRLTTGVCFVALQKKIGADLGRSADLALEKPLLYISLHRGGVARIEKCKTEWTEDFHPYKIEYRYKILNGGKLVWGKQPRTKINHFSPHMEEQKYVL